jgi:ribosomal protein S18 acetylase RimI-like enzyme
VAIIEHARAVETLRSLQPISSLPASRFRRLFDEESEMWSASLRWNFAPTRRRLEVAIDEGHLRGFFVSDADGPSAYATYSIEDGRGLVGCLFASERARAHGIEDHLAGRVLERLMGSRSSVIDCQTLFTSKPEMKAPFESAGFQSAERLYMTLDAGRWQAPAATGSVMSRPILRTDARSVSPLVYHAHEDTRARDASSSFDTLESCESILRQIMLDQICGPFDALASRRIEVDGRNVAACLLTWPSTGVAHISEVATATDARRRGFARQCIVGALASVFERGATTATLSVTASNAPAIALYESFGFSPRVRYQSHLLKRAPEQA